MVNFFKGQYDYIYFFYGLAFFLLAMVCFNIKRSGYLKLPWFLLGLFGITHGANEWIDLFILIYNTNRALSIIHPVLLGISYIFLFEFARIGLGRLGKKRSGPWIYIIPLICIFLTRYLGLEGLKITLRYFLGFPAALFAAWTIFKASYIEIEHKKSLMIFSSILAFYALFTGLIVPKGEFLLAPWINFDSFYGLFHFPVQLVRGILGLSLAMAILSYSPVLSDMSYRHKKLRTGFAPTKLGIVLIIVLLIGCGWIFTNYLDYYAGMQIIKNRKINDGSQLHLLTRDILTLEKITLSMSRSSIIRDGLLSSNAANLKEVSLMFEHYLAQAGALNCSLIDKDGKVIASTGEDILEEISGKSHTGMPYFHEALTGNIGYHFLVGSQEGERIYFVSSPVKDMKREIAGIVLVTKKIPVKPVIQWYRLMSIFITLIICIITINLAIMLRKREALVELVEKANVQLQEIDTLKTDFISIVSHELRTPLTAIKNAATILVKLTARKEAFDQKEAELLDIILSSTERQTRMVNDLLDISKIEAGVIPLLIEDIDIPDLTKEAIDYFRQQASDKKITLMFSIEATTKIIPSDKEHFRRIIINLVDNAIKYTDENGKVTLSIREEKTNIIVSVSDTGIGMSGQELKKLFTKFYRTPEADMLQKSGSGLGLVITKGLVETLGGKIWVESEPGKGSSFYFSLPKSRQDAEKRRVVCPTKKRSSL